MNDSIKKMLRITEKDLMITEVSYETLQKKKTLVVDAVLSPTPRACRSCGSTVVDGNGKAIIVKNGKKETIVRFEQYNHIELKRDSQWNNLEVNYPHRPVKVPLVIGKMAIIFPITPGLNNFQRY
ncbi:hypothetical protein EfmJHP35_22440 [Enterococcus faecium]|nr:hypothetical protein EfmJHP35_22440 [Enterococcus faecium]